MTTIASLLLATAGAIAPAVVYTPSSGTDFAALAILGAVIFRAALDCAPRLTARAAARLG